MSVTPVSFKWSNLQTCNLTIKCLKLKLSVESFKDIWLFTFAFWLWDSFSAQKIGPRSLTHLLSQLMFQFCYGLTFKSEFRQLVFYFTFFSISCRGRDISQSWREEDQIVNHACHQMCGFNLLWSYMQWIKQMRETRVKSDLEKVFSLSSRHQSINWTHIFHSQK